MNEGWEIDADKIKCLESERDRLKADLENTKAVLYSQSDLWRSKAEELAEVLEGIRLYNNDTLSGRTDCGGPENREWYREGIIEVRNRANAALAEGEKK